jgi:hypothetical protein
MSSAFILFFVATRLTVNGLSAYYDSPKNSFGWVGFVYFIVIAIPLVFALNSLAIKCIGIWYPSYAKEARKLWMVLTSEERKAMDESNDT